MGNEKKLDSETSSKLQEKGKYYKKIEILEAVVLDKEEKSKGEKEIYIKDFSSYFDVKIENTELNEIIKKEKENDRNSRTEKIKEFIEDFFNKKFKRLDQYWKIEEKSDILNDRVYKLDFSKIENNKLEENGNELKVLLNDKFKDININNVEITNIYVEITITKKKDDNKEKKYTIYLSDIKKVFNIKSFFQDHESLFSQDNDFEESDKQALYLNVKESENKSLENLETKIFTLPDKNKFFVEVILDSETSAEGQEDVLEISGEKKYKYVFFTERGEYLKGSLKNNKNKNE